MRLSRRATCLSASRSEFVIVGTRASHRRNKNNAHAAGFRLYLTDEQGRFVLRDLPAGELVVSVVPISPVPADLRAPAGRLRLPIEPIQVENATIVIDNPRLVEHLVPIATTSDLP